MYVRYSVPRPIWYIHHSFGLVEIRATSHDHLPSQTAETRLVDVPKKSLISNKVKPTSKDLEFMCGRSRRMRVTVDVRKRTRDLWLCQKKR